MARHVKNAYSEVENGRKLDNNEALKETRRIESDDVEMVKHRNLENDNVKMERLRNFGNHNIKMEKSRIVESHIVKVKRPRNFENDDIEVEKSGILEDYDVKEERPRNFKNNDANVEKSSILENDNAGVEGPKYLGNFNAEGVIQEIGTSKNLAKSNYKSKDANSSTDYIKVPIKKVDNGVSQTKELNIKENDDKLKTVNKTAKNKDLINMELYYKLRKSEIAHLKNATRDNNPYPHKFNVTVSLEEILEQYKYLRNGELLEDVNFSIAGRVLSIRKSRLHSLLYELKTEGGVIRVMAISKMYQTEEDFVADTEKIRRGDIIGCVGHPGKTKKGELSIVAKTVKLLSPCLHKLPNTTLTNGTKLKTRYLDLILNDKSKQIFSTRAKIISYIRNFLDNMGFLEVETPILHKVPGGGTAKPFKTHHDLMDIDYYLRISPELYHKMLVIGGLERIYEIGRQFRNEKIDSTHNPEFTSLEFYMAYADYYDLIDITEILLSGLIKSIHNSYKVKYHPKGRSGEEVEVDFTPPYPRIYLLPALEKALNVTFPPANELHTPEANVFLVQLCDKYQVDCSPPWTSARIIDSLVGEFIQEHIVHPTFIMDYPQIMSPLAKQHRDHSGLTERFELYVMKKELCNAYTELNDPVLQRKRFIEQEKDRLAGDEEVPPSDEEYIRAMEYGLPPTAGLGLGIDRLVMFLTDSINIKDVLLFPAEQPKNPKK
ncbi:lysine--tRNA ligase-like isoform X2 [Pectinophora gossypiella]|nr:lysine--tRNA ligase-like isoform X2 [Pectinophora gossypiella]